MKKIAIQGVPGSYHDIAAHKFFPGEEIELICCSTFEEVFANIKQDSNVIGMLAIENTIAGSLLHNYELLRESGMTIVGEHKLRIKHSFMCLPDDNWETLTEVNSHPVALAQCREFLIQHPKLKIVETEDTAGSAEAIKRENLKGHAAICSRYAADLYGMKVLEEGIETNKHNFTRFLVVADPWKADDLRERSRVNKANIVFSLPHNEGSLSQVLSIFSFYKINLTKIQSLPIIGREWEYLFYVDVIFNDYLRYKQSIDAVSPLTKELKILGEYAEGTSTIYIQPADRLANVSEYYFSRKLKEVAQMNAEGKNVISLGIGSPDMPPSEETVNVLCEQAKRPDAHGYQPTVGILELRKAMADWYKRWYHVELDPATEIQPLIGSKEGILHVTLALVNPGDQVLVPNPGYPTYTSLNKILGSEIVNYNLREDNHWQPDFDELEKMDLSRVKIMWTNYPNMPTGANATMELYEKLVNFARRHNIVIVNDNPYSFILNKKPLSILNVPGAKECCIEFNSMSKSHNMPGWRVGMLATNAQFVQWILKIKSNIDSGTFRPMQLAAAQAYNNSVEWHEEANVNVYSRRRQLAEEIMKVLGCSFDPNQVGMFLWGRIPESYNDVEELTEKVLHEARVFITPGFIFGSNGKRYIRISLCAKEEKLAEALERIKKIM